MGIKLFVLAAILGIAARSEGLTIVSDPSFSPAANAPLSGVLQVTTDELSRVSVSVNDGVSTWERRFFDFSTAHTIPLFGFKPGRDHQITVTVYDRNRNAVTASEPLVFTTDPLPDDFPDLSVRTSDPQRMEPGYTLFRVSIHNNADAYVVIVDNAGEVVWYDQTPSTADVRLLENGHLFMPSVESFVEMNLLGETVNSWLVSGDFPINEHDGVPTPHGTILFLSDAQETVPGMPTSATDPNAPTTTAQVLYQRVVELSITNAAVLNTWSPVNQLDPRRISYLTGPAYDSEHSNAVIEDPSDDSLIISMRNQNAVIKIARNTGELRWILGPHEDWGAQWQPYLLTPVGSPFEWQYGQHAPVLTPAGTLLLYDDGNARAMPFASPVLDSTNYSRAVEYRIDEQTMEVSQVWDYGRTNVSEILFTPYEGNAEPLPKTGNVLIGFPAVSWINGAPPSSYGPTATMVRIKEVTHDEAAQTVFDLAISMFDKLSPYADCTIYRCHRIPDLYAHPASPVVDLVLTDRNNSPVLQFSADNAHTYVIEVSDDLSEWQRLGLATEPEPNSGEFEFADGYGHLFSNRFYRIVTE